MALGRQVTREASIYLAGFVGAAFLQFLAVPIYTRYLGPERYSYYALTLAITTSLAGLLVIGGDIALTRFWFEAKSQEQRRNLALTWISFLTAWSVIVVGDRGAVRAGTGRLAPPRLRPRAPAHRGPC